MDIYLTIQQFRQDGYFQGVKRSIKEVMDAVCKKEDILLVTCKLLDENADFEHLSEGFDTEFYPGNFVMDIHKLWNNFCKNTTSDSLKDKEERLKQKKEEYIKKHLPQYLKENPLQVKCFDDFDEKKEHTFECKDEYEFARKVSEFFSEHCAEELQIINENGENLCYTKKMNENVSKGYRGSAYKIFNTLAENSFLTTQPTQSSASHASGLQGQYQSHSSPSHC